LPASDRLVGWRDYGGVLVVQADIAGEQIELLVDTGSALTAITPRTADRLGLDRSTFTGRRVVFTAGGASMTVPTGQIPTLQLGISQLRGVEVALMDLPVGVAVDGLLGVNVLDRFRATFDFRHATLVLRPEPLR
jgi:clan AA aspartic protease (TIGR02281 family)